MELQKNSTIDGNYLQNEVEKQTDSISNSKNGGQQFDEGQQQQQDFRGWKRFKQWIHCFCVVTFDLELGQTIEVVYPGTAQLSSSERSDICYLSFPDSNCSASSTSSPRSQFLNGNRITRKVSSDGTAIDSTHHFRIRKSGDADDVPDKCSEQFARRLPAPLRPDPRFFYGFAHFRRQRDSTIPRGYSQKSIVLISHLPFVSLFSRILSEIAMAFFTAGEIAIETACRQIGQHWPAPKAGGDRLLSLPLFGLRFCCSVPADSHANVSELDLGNGCERAEQKNSSRHKIQLSLEDEDFGFELVDVRCNVVHLDSVNEPDQHFHTGIKRILPHLHILWELVLLGEPLLVYAPNPALCSSIVHSLVSLISPLRYESDFRPYFTIHDSDFNEICTKQNCLFSSYFLGVSNPFFLKVLAHWPHILKLSEPRHRTLRRERSESRLIRQLRTQAAAQFVLGTIKRCGTTSKELNQHGIDFEEDEEEWEEGQQQKLIKRVSDRTQLERRSGGFFSSHRPFLTQDKTLPRRLLRSPSDSSSQWSTLRWHFTELTQSFMSPLESYIATLMPLRRELCPFQTVPQMRPFSLEQFLASIKHAGHPGVKGDWLALYRQFVTRSPNFIGWLHRRRSDIERQLRFDHMEAICSANFTPELLSQRDQVEIVDLVLKLSNRFVELEERKQRFSSSKRRQRIGDGSHSPLTEKMERQRVQLHRQLKSILTSVDEDLKAVLLSNPTFRKVAEHPDGESVAAL